MTLPRRLDGDEIRLAVALWVRTRGDACQPSDVQLYVDTTTNELVAVVGASPAVAWMGPVGAVEAENT